MQLKRATDILLRIFVYLASHPDEDHVSIHDLSEALNWNKNLVIKVAHQIRMCCSMQHVQYAAVPY